MSHFDTSQAGEFFTVDELAALLRRTPTAIYSERYRGEGIAALGVQVGRRILWRRSDIDAWFDRQIEKAAAG